MGERDGAGGGLERESALDVGAREPDSTGRGAASELAARRWCRYDMASQPGGRRRCRGAAGAVVADSSRALHRFPPRRAEVAVDQAAHRQRGGDSLARQPWPQCRLILAPAPAPKARRTSSELCMMSSSMMARDSERRSVPPREGANGFLRWCSDGCKGVNSSSGTQPGHPGESSTTPKISLGDIESCLPQPGRSGKKIGKA